MLGRAEVAVAWIREHPSLQLPGPAVITAGLVLHGPGGLHWSYLWPVP